MRCASAAPPTALRKGAAHKGAIWWGTKPSSFTNLRGGCPFSTSSAATPVRPTLKLVSRRDEA